MNDLTLGAEAPLLIGINGVKYAGKSTVAECLQSFYRFKELAFADPIKRALAAAFRVEIAVFYDPALKEVALPELMGQSPRHLMQTLGTDWGRNMISKSLWIDLAMVKVQQLRESGRPRIVISDVRRDNEAQAVIDAGGVVWNVWRPLKNNDEHESEEGIAPHLISERLLNDGTLRSLYFQVGEALERLRSHNGADVGALPTL